MFWSRVEKLETIREMLKLVKPVDQTRKAFQKSVQETDIYIMYFLLHPSKEK